MKTVIHAVNEFKGEWDSIMGTCLWYYPGNDSYIFGNSAYGDNLVCTKKEFNQCVDKMSNNFGSGSQLRLHKWQREHSLEFRVVPFKEVKTVTVPVYTQEMGDNRKLPPIGSEYLDEDGQLCKALLHYGSFVLGEMLEHCHTQQYPVFSTSRNDRLSRVTPPIELIDGKAYQFYIEGFKAVGFYSKHRDSFESNSHNVCLVSEADEIQPLTLEVKS